MHSGEVPGDGERAGAHNRNRQGHAGHSLANFVRNIIKAFITVIEALSRGLQCRFDLCPPVEEYPHLIPR